jgi:hypothetical protein
MSSTQSVDLKRRTSVSGVKWRQLRTTARRLYAGRVFVRRGSVPGRSVVFLYSAHALSRLRSTDAALIARRSRHTWCAVCAANGSRRTRNCCPPERADVRNARTRATLDYVEDFREALIGADCHPATVAIKCSP